MSASKEQKLKKIQNTHIWPHILGLIIFSIVIMALFTGIVLMYSRNIFSTKLSANYLETRRIVDMVSEEGGRLGYSDIERLMPSVSAITIMNADKTVKESYGMEIPDFTDMFPLYFEADYRVYIDTDNADLLIGSNSATFVINGDKIVKAFENGGYGELLIYDVPHIGNDDKVASVKLWYVISLPEGKTAAIRNEFSITASELISIAGGIALMLAVFLIMFVYHIVSFINLVRNKRRLLAALYTDKVTGGRNAYYFYRQCSKLIKKGKRRQIKYAVVNLRLEKYRSYCACFGVKTGEELLENCDGMLLKLLNGSESSAHLDNSDFGLLLTYNEENALESRIKSIMDCLAGLRPGQKLYFSAGICRVESPDDDIEIISNNAAVARGTLSAESAEYTAWYNDELKKQRLWEATVESDMERAIANHEFKVYLQPKYSTKEEVLSAAEALVRWVHPKEGFIPPYKFIPIFENNGFILQLDDYMITEVARLQAKWIAEGKTVVPISVNVSRAHFTRPDLAEHICRIVDSFNVPHDVIELELTESAFFDDKEVLLGTVHKMKELGFAVSMDDFGAGYSSLNSLKELPLDVVKLDAEFFRGEGEKERGKLIVSETIELAKKLGMRIVAEGIETREQVDFLANEECDLIQGYYFAKPMPVEEFEGRAFPEAKEETDISETEKQ